MPMMGSCATLEATTSHQALGNTFSGLSVTGSKKKRRKKRKAEGEAGGAEAAASCGSLLRAKRNASERVDMLGESLSRLLNKMQGVDEQLSRFEDAVKKNTEVVDSAEKKLGKKVEELVRNEMQPLIEYEVKGSLQRTLEDELSRAFAELMRDAMDAAETAVGEAVRGISAEERPFKEEGIRSEVQKGV